MATTIGMALRAMPVAINCYYGDPTLQWKDTVAKLKDLAATGHTGPVAVITKGSIGPERARQLARVELPGLIVMYSISELPHEIEPLGQAHRYRSIANLRDAGVKVFAAVRPLTPPYNTSEEVLTRIFTKLQKVGCEVACVSGFRGDESLIEAMHPDEKIQWVLRVKQMTGFDTVVRIANEHGVRLFTRVSCAVSYLTGRASTYNPYWGSPNLVRCEAIGCPLIDTCGPTPPDPVLLDWLRSIGYDLEVVDDPRTVCTFSSDTRLNCLSCCTTCFVQQQPRVVCHNAHNLGDLTFARFVLGGTLVSKPGMVDGGVLDVGHAKILQKAIGGGQYHAINTWWVYTTVLNHCYGCTYCISSIYPNTGLIGCPPADLEMLVRNQQGEN